MNITALKTDKIGILASSLCMIHCIATPFLFIAKSCSTTCCETAPNWYSSLDFIFLLISFFAVYRSSKNTFKNWLKYAMWGSWFLLLVILLNEKMGYVAHQEYFIYIPAFSLIILHLVNLKNCRCNTNNHYKLD